MSKFSLKILVNVFLIVFSLNTFSQQEYKTGIGLRGGYPSGITVKHFLTDKSAAEGVLSLGWGGFGITGLYQLHNNIPDAPGFKWYYGIGGHLATANSEKANPYASSKGGELFIGIDGVLGAEYVFPDAPISISLDILPILNIVEEPGVWFNAGLSVRYVIK